MVNSICESHNFIHFIHKIIVICFAIVSSYSYLIVHDLHIHVLYIHDLKIDQPSEYISHDVTGWCDQCDQCDEYGDVVINVML